MGKGTKAGIAALTTIIIAIIGLFASGGDFSFDFSNTNIGQIGDNIINNYLADQGIDLEGFKELCDNGEVEQQFIKYCDLV